MIKTFGTFAVLAVLASPAMAQSEVYLDVSFAEATIDEMTTQPIIKLALSSEGQAAFAQFSGEHVGKQVDVVVDGTVVTSPWIREPILGGWMTLSGSFTAKEMRIMADWLNEEDAKILVRLAAKQKSR